MADSQVKTHVPQAAIFQSDPTEQIFSKGILDRDMSGLSYMFLNAAQQRRDADQEEYMKGVSEANRINTALHQQDIMSKQAIEVLKQAVEMSTKVGSPTNTMPIMRMLQPSGINDPGAAAKLALLQSEAAANNAKAAGESKPEFTQESIVTPSGVSQELLKMRMKGGMPAMAQETLNQRVRAALAARGITGSGPGGTGLPNANPVDVSRTQEYLRGRGGN